MHENKLFLVISIMEVDRHTYAKKTDDSQLIANHPFFYLRQSFFSLSSFIFVRT